MNRQGISSQSDAVSVLECQQPHSNHRINDSDCFLQIFEACNNASLGQNSDKLEQQPHEKKAEAHQNELVLPDHKKNHAAISQSWNGPEKKLFYQLYLEKGPKWTLIASLLRPYNTRSENEVKNKFYGTLRKTLRQMNKVAQNILPKSRKQIKYESLMRVLESRERGFRLPEWLLEKAEGVRRNIVSLMSNEEPAANETRVAEILEEVNSFNLASRCYRFKKYPETHIAAKFNSPRPNCEVTIRKVPSSQSPQNARIQNYPQQLLSSGRTKENEDIQDFSLSAISCSQMDELELPIIAPLLPIYSELQSFEKEILSILGESYAEREELSF